jgi:MFS family permease
VTNRPGPVHSIGTLSYSRGGLAGLFGWLLWGDFILTIMETVLPALLPLLLEANKATKGEIVVIVTTLAMMMNALLNPIISYNSDRFRSRWGRRRPFIVVTTPLVVLFLAAVPYAPDFTAWLGWHRIPFPIPGWLQESPVILIFGALTMCYQTFNMFVASVYYYLIPDVVPSELLGRFYALFRFFGILAAMIFNYFVFGFAQSHMKEVFVVISCSYGFFMLLMCWQVKEGNYPAPLVEDHAHWWSGIRNYAQECFGSSHYWWVFLAYSTLTWSGISNVFGVFFYRDELGLTLDQIGKASAYGSMAFLVLAYPLGVLLDRWGCHRMLITGTFLMGISSIATFCFASHGEGSITWIILRSLPIVITSLTMGKWTVDVYPRDRYGQFGSAGALFASLGGVILGPFCGWWMSFSTHDRTFLLWNAVFSFVGFAAAIKVYCQTRTPYRERSP